MMPWDTPVNLILRVATCTRHKSVFFLFSSALPSHNTVYSEKKSPSLLHMESE